MQNIRFGKLHIPNYEANRQNLNALISNPQTRDIAMDTFNKINKKTANEDVFLHVTKNEERDLPTNEKLNWYTVSIVDKNNESLASEVILKGYSDDINDTQTFSFKKHMISLEKQVPQMGETPASAFFDMFA